MFEKKEVKSSLSHLLSGCIIIAILLVMVPISYRLPGSSKVIFSSYSYNLEIYHLIVFVLVIAIIVVLFNIRSSAQLLLGNLLSGREARRYFNVKPLSDSIIDVIYIPIIYVVALMFVKKIAALFPALDWLFTVLTVALLGFILIFLVPLYRNLRIYFETSVSPSTKKVVAKQENTSFIICPNCGHKNPTESKFCVSCGAKLTEVSEEKTKEKKEEVEIPATEESRLICPDCECKNPPGSKFCVNCGAPLNSSDTSSKKKLHKKE
jgi:ribosomal protein L40E